MANESYIASEVRSLRAAMKALEAGAQSATVSTLGGQRSYTRPDLKAMHEREKDLIRQYYRAGMRKRVAPNFGDNI